MNKQNNTELKTLKDIKSGIQFRGEIAIRPSLLRAEAVGWVKHLESEKIRLKEDLDQVINCADRIEMFKHFFNLTEEDLK